MTIAGNVQTVQGPVAPEEIGLALTHEHLLFDLSASATSPVQATRRLGLGPHITADDGLASTASALRRWNQPIRPENLADVQRNWMLYRAAIQQLDVEVAIREVESFRRAGGGCLVDMTPVGLARDPGGLLEVSRATGTHVVMGAGYYTSSFHPESLDTMSEDDITQQIVNDITVGVQGVRAGVIGEVGLNWPLLGNEEKVLRASVNAQVATGAPLAIHPGHSPEAPLAIMKAVVDLGGDPVRTLMCHVDNRIFDIDAQIAVAETGCYIGLDSFGREGNSYRQLGAMDVPNDATRINYAIALTKAGYGARILLSQDLAQAFLMKEYGGFGLAHIPENVTRLMRIKGISEAQITEYLVENPGRFLAFNQVR